MAQAAAAAEVAGRPAFVAEVEKANLHPLWDRYKRITPFQPMPKDTPCKTCDSPYHAFSSRTARSEAVVEMSGMPGSEISLDHVRVLGHGLVVALSENFAARLVPCTKVAKSF